MTNYLHYVVKKFCFRWLDDLALRYHEVPCLLDYATQLEHRCHIFELACSARKVNVVTGCHALRSFRLSNFGDSVKARKNSSQMRRAHWIDVKDLV